MDKTNATYMSPTLGDSLIPSDGVPIIQPKELLPRDTIASPIIPDKDLAFILQNSNVLTSDDPSQTISGTFKFGNGWLVIDDLGKRIIINDGKTDRILIGKY